VFDQWGELPLLPFGNPIGFVPASRGRVYIELSNNRRDAESAENFPFAQSGDGDWAKTTGDKAIRGRPTGSKLCVRFRFTTLFDRESINPCQAERVLIESDFG